MDSFISVRLGVTNLVELKNMLLQKNPKSVKHLLQHPTHCIDFNTPTILSSENDTARLLILESLFKQEQTPDLNNDS